MISKKDIQDIKRRAGITEQVEKTAASAYHELVDGLHDMLRSRRLKQGDIPDDYQW